MKTQFEAIAHRAVAYAQAVEARRQVEAAYRQAVHSRRISLGVQDERGVHLLLPRNSAEWASVKQATKSEYEELKRARATESAKKRQLMTAYQRWADDEAFRAAGELLNRVARR